MMRRDQKKEASDDDARHLWTILLVHGLEAGVEDLESLGVEVGVEVPLVVGDGLIAVGFVVVAFVAVSLEVDGAEEVRSAGGAFHGLFEERQGLLPALDDADEGEAPEACFGSVDVQCMICVVAVVAEDHLRLYVSDLGSRRVGRERLVVVEAADVADQALVAEAHEAAGGPPEVEGRPEARLGVPEEGRDRAAVDVLQR